jgi:hypothetical protein
MDVLIAIDRGLKALVLGAMTSCLMAGLTSLKPLPHYYFND